MKKQPVTRVSKSKEEKAKAVSFLLGGFLAMLCHVGIGFVRLLRALLIAVGVCIAVPIVLCLAFSAYVWSKFADGFSGTRKRIAMRLYQMVMKPNCAICHQIKEKKQRIVFDLETDQFTHPDCIWAQELVNIILGGYYREAAAFLKLSREEHPPKNIRFPMDTVGFLLYRALKSSDAANESIQYVEALASKMTVEEASFIYARYN